MGHVRESVKKHNTVNYGIFGYEESRHYEVQRMAKLINVEIPSYKEFCEELGVEGIYNCNTTQGFIDDDSREYVVPNIEQYDQDERISWVEFMRRIERKKK